MCERDSVSSRCSVRYRYRIIEKSWCVKKSAWNSFADLDVSGVFQDLKAVWAGKEGMGNVSIVLILNVIIFIQCVWIINEDVTRAFVREEIIESERDDGRSVK